MRYWKKLSILLILVVVVISIGMVFASEKQVPSFVVTPMSGEPGTKLIFYGAGFIPGEKVKVIMTVDEVPYAFAVVGTGGFVTVNENGAFKLQPAGGIPTVLLKAGVYTIEAVGDKGSRATTPLEVLEKKQ
ncbi:hypothetical protein CVT91_04130 [Candidatus Atribacteria bacterium HGW-Atribacteria-1]|nr:MAG: hypothetical protein CVT91_04130 [Candidatus Atribacteria bacterium HGW-Atribacteria-1]